MNMKSLAIGAGLLLVATPAVIPAPGTITDPAWFAVGLTLTMALWWITEAVPLAATALLPLAIVPIFGIANVEDVASAYSHPLIVLFLGGFLLAKAIETSGLHRRMAFALLGTTNRSPEMVLAAVMAATAFLSLWISNTASAMVMAPIAAALAAGQPGRAEFGTAVMLGVAYSATIGGMGSLIGTPPNAIFAAHLSTTYGVDVGFAQWAAVGLPVAAVLLTLAWLVLARLTPGGLRGGELALPTRRSVEPMLPAERRVAVIMCLTAMAWIGRPAIERFLPELELTDAGIAMLAAFAVFLVPDGRGKRLLDWEAAATIRWDVLILFGGGLALAGIIESSGLSALIGAAVRGQEHLSPFILVLAMAGLVVCMGELASNTAIAAIFLPIAGAMAISLDVDPIIFMLPVAMSSSLGFMLPVATPPNAIVFVNPSVTRSAMLRAGAPLDLFGIVVTVALTTALAPVFFG